MNGLRPPTSYQGGKQRIAGAILDFIGPFDAPFYDFCAGSGAISLELLSRGFQPCKITMIEAGPWGLFWKSIADGLFDIAEFERICTSLPREVNQIQAWMKDTARKPVNTESLVYDFILLQAASFGGKAIWIKNGLWQNTTFRSLWLPTATSNRRSHVNPMMPMPQEIVVRIKKLMLACRGMQVICSDATLFSTPTPPGVCYIDPPYQKTTKYGHDINYPLLIERLSKAELKVYISEGKPISDRAIQICAQRRKGGISGERSSFNEEWLSEIVKRRPICEM